jgi:hypothetical protein
MTMMETPVNGPLRKGKDNYAGSASFLFLLGVALMI